MVVDTLLGLLKMPFFVVVLLISSYLIWSKFLNKSGFKIKDVNNLLDILAIFLFLLVSIGGVVILGLMLLGIINLTLDLPQILKASSSLIAGIGILFIIYFVMSFRNKDVEKKDLENYFKKVISFISIITIFLTSFYALILFTSFKNFIGSNIILTLFISIGILIICWGIVTNTLFGEKIEKLLDRKSILPQEHLSFTPIFILGH